jgi:tripartite-type tricarboxylate transporter receptor subunit TctC
MPAKFPAIFLIIAVIAAAHTSPILAADDDYPSRPVRLIATSAAGGNLDITARLTAQFLGETLKQQFIVDNKPGANSMLATEFTVRSAPDGYTLVVVSNAHSTNPTLVAKMPYDTLKDLASISVLTTQSNILIVNTEVPAKSVRELVALAKAKPGELFYGSSGNGSSGNLAAELFNGLAGTKITQVPYKGTAQLINDVISGRIQLSFSSLTSVLPNIKAGKLRALGSTGVKRSPAAPDIPTIAEAGVPGYRSVNWTGLLGPAAVPRPVIAKLNRTVVQRWATPEVQAKFTALGADARASSPEEMDDFIREEIKTWAKVIKDANIKVDLD